ncbi:phosphonate transporter [Methylobacterium pseudosasicola]|uniref:Photoactive yellow protein n=1 Tax=Methylobacterium pseudosasicola TaxID=582667 RepID=A0A1I4V3M2_9HYPH|nr:phosphonate transporter [Methylobacterium pseudosasicola]SFM95864.1 photoactive yellow protein [Methylobacterium pseudosasicola]
MHTFEGISIDELESLEWERLDALPYGVVGLSPEGIVEIYNATEERLAGLSRDGVIGTHYFSSTAQCMNNFMVAQRFEDEPEIDAVIDYVLTLRMRPTPVRLRLMKAPKVDRRFILIQR